MARKKAGPRRPPPQIPSAPAFPPLVEAEPDLEWQRWFKEVEFRRRNRRDPAKLLKSMPATLKKVIRLEEKKTGRKVAPDVDALVRLWEATVGAEVASESCIYSFKSGVLTISIFSSSLLQEIRQFSQKAIEQDLRDVWNLPTPLLRVAYRVGKRKP